jgi:hypothetical protein
VEPRAVVAGRLLEKGAANIGGHKIVILLTVTFNH